MKRAEEFKQAVREYLKENKLPQVRLSRLAGVYPNVISNLLNGVSISEQSAEKIALAMGDEYKQYVEYKNCTVCGKEFAPRTEDVDVCSHECMLVNNPNRARYEKNHAIGKKKKKADVSKTETEARKSGLSYGYYVALKACERSNTERK